VRAFVDELQPDERTGPGDATVRGVEQPDLGFLVRRHRIDQLDADALPVRASGDEVVFDHPLDEALRRDRRCIVQPGGLAHALAQFRRRAWRDAIDHGVRAGGVGTDPVEQHSVAGQGDELQQAATETLAVVAQVVAVEQGDRT